MKKHMRTKVVGSRTHSQKERVNNDKVSMANILLRTVLSNRSK